MIEPQDDARSNLLGWAVVGNVAEHTRSGVGGHIESGELATLRRHESMDSAPTVG